MPRNNQTVPRHERESAIVAYASDLFLSAGYRNTSIAAVARAAGIATGAVNWYFPTKDDLFAAVIRAYFSDEIHRIQSDPESCGDAGKELADALAALVPYRLLHREAYERMEVSPAVRGAYSEVQDWVDERLLAAIRDRVPTGTDIESITDVAHILAEGVLISGRRRDRPTEELLELIIDLLATAAAGSPFILKAHEIS
ncbi:MAG: TetR/AcrR family transcriptional regulator [Comamonadaceae bacterium]|nr:MAG: TetR/AcrR family transcriptional regulator [Comamonadaceae bacterium]